MQLQFPPTTQIVEVRKRMKNAVNANRRDKQKTFVQRNLHYRFYIDIPKENLLFDQKHPDLSGEGCIAFNI